MGAMLIGQRDGFGDLLAAHTTHNGRTAMLTTPSSEAQRLGVP